MSLSSYAPLIIANDSLRYKSLLPRRGGKEVGLFVASTVVLKTSSGFHALTNALSPLACTHQTNDLCVVRITPKSYPNLSRKIPLTPIAFHWSIDVCTVSSN